jgi:fluoroquinolone transport system ATP-binding protein
MMISVKNLEYSYPGAQQQVLKGLQFDIAEREIFGFLGPSGAGKSTTQKLLIGLLRNYSGQVRVMDKEIADWGSELYEHVGVSFELPNHFLKLTARENLAYFRSLYSNETLPPKEVLRWVGLQDDADKKVAEFSKGMKMRLNVARSLMHRPKLLFLDEPTNGLDPANARRIKDLILRLRAEGTTVFVTTHDMTVADELCDRVAFITNGRINVADAPSALKKQYGKRTLFVEYLDSDDVILRQEFSLDGLGDNERFLELLKTVDHIETIHTQETTLENIFIQVTGQELVE